MSVEGKSNDHNDFSYLDENILIFAKKISGGDPSTIPVLKEAVQEGFAAAEEQCGYELPDISYQTLQNVMEGFYEWEESGNA